MPGGSRHEYAVLDRGSACLQCKKRKKRCDGERPICGPCVRFGTEDQCEYPKPIVPKPKPKPSPPLSKSELMRAQIRDLEGQLATLQRHVEVSQISGPSTVPSTGSLGTLNDPHSTSDAMDEDDDGADQPPLSPATRQSPHPAQIDPEVTEELLLIFLQNYRRCACELDGPRFEQHLREGLESSASGAHPGLVSAVMLLGCHFALCDEDHRFVEHEVYFLSESREKLGKSLTNADRLLDFLRGSTFLVWYFFAKGRIAEAQYHASGLASFAAACRLNTIDPTERETTPIISGPKDDVDLEERISLFWTIFILDRYASLMCSTSSAIRNENVWTPWPRPPEEWTLPRDSVRMLIIQSSTQFPPLDALPFFHSELGYRALGITLMERSMHLARSFNLQGPKQQYYVADVLQSLESTAEIVRKSRTMLPSLAQAGHFSEWSEASAVSSFPAQASPQLTPDMLAYAQTQNESPSSATELISPFGSSASTIGTRFTDANVTAATWNEAAAFQQSLSPYAVQNPSSQAAHSSQFFAPSPQSPSSNPLAAEGSFGSSLVISPYSSDHSSSRAMGSTISDAASSVPVSLQLPLPHPLRRGSAGGSSSDNSLNADASGSPYSSPNSYPQPPSALSASLLFAHTSIALAQIHIARAKRSDLIRRAQGSQSAIPSLHSPNAISGMNRPSAERASSSYRRRAGYEAGPLPVSIKVPQSQLGSHALGQALPVSPFGPSPIDYAGTPPQSSSWHASRPASPHTAFADNSAPQEHRATHRTPGAVASASGGHEVEALQAARKIADMASIALSDKNVFEELDMMIGFAWSAALALLAGEADRLASQLRELSPRSSGISPPTSGASGFESSRTPGLDASSQQQWQSVTNPMSSQPSVYGQSSSSGASYSTASSSGTNALNELLVDLQNRRQTLSRAIALLSANFQLVGIMRQ